MWSSLDVVVTAVVVVFVVVVTVVAVVVFVVFVIVAVHGVLQWTWQFCSCSSRGVEFFSAKETGRAEPTLCMKKFCVYLKRTTEVHSGKHVESQNSSFLHTNYIIFRAIEKILI